MEKAVSFEDSIAWQKAHQFVLDVYKLSQKFPDSEKFGLTSQLRRSAVSIAANIAEDFKKRSNKEKIKYLNISQDSLEENRYYLILAKDLGYGYNSNFDEITVEISKLLYSYIKKLEE